MTGGTGPSQRTAAGRGASRTPTALTIAGSDSGGGAGIQADLKAFAACGVHGMSAITAVTAQSTTGVSAIHVIPPEIVLAQVRAVVEDIGVDAVKVGMLANAETILAVARAIDGLPRGTPVVVDPVMVAESGARLLEPRAQRVLIEEILPRATVLTPNLPEARVLADPGSGQPGSPPVVPQGDAEEQQEVEQLARTVLALGPGAVVLTGGHRARAADLFLEAAGAGDVVSIEGERHGDGATHGSGCTHSAVLAAQLALGRTPLEAATIAREMAGAAVAGGLRDIGRGAGPVDVLGLARIRSG
ncbi:MAG TPA: bifunctional hydroxymethylpyrimidine kinase/phosphomethylpyrimidine kinase [Solirubrobacteraceae bacterium]|jgi:hydroxymethylpyrimidine/phosphomethylpyrimidine kinase|nr:bifunctional hydroxymethylpyrimidine kinase/phosphomethylpyrimidine kinase [Solirubrobacteraceae bacterium]